jgi:ferric-dicitrate binding protein FerR (iron transport regulator)
MSDTLDRLVRESRPDMGTREAQNLDWERVDRAVFDRIEAEQRAERASLVRARGGGRWAYVAGGLAAAAALALVVGKLHEPAGASVRTVVDETAGNVVAVEGDGQLLVGGHPMVAGGALHLGDVVEARGVQVTVERPGKLSMVIERGTRAEVTHVQGALVLALEEGAVEAQVVPVPSGEAFAVDVGPSRVAVHGTHLRVARAGDHVVVDLSEGVVSLGPAPRVGSTLGALVTAPAHADFSAGDESSLAVTHDPGALRVPIAIGASTAAKPAAVAAVPVAKAGEPGDLGARPPAQVLGAPHAEFHPSAPGAAPHATAPVDANPEATIAGAVRWCLSERPHADNVTVVVNTVVYLDVDAEGSVVHARFDPPVAPDVNACASSAIYRARFGHGGTVAVPVDLRLPSSAP